MLDPSDLFLETIKTQSKIFKWAWQVSYNEARKVSKYNGHRLADLSALKIHALTYTQKEVYNTLIEQSKLLMIQWDVIIKSVSYHGLV